MVTSRKIAAIPWYGGKFRRARYIVPIIESIPHKIYVEPCAGGASVFMWRAADPKRVDVLNDINQDAYALYRAMKLYPAEFCRELYSIPYSESAYKSYGAIEVCADRSDVDSVVTRGLSAYVRCSMSFGNSLLPTKGVNYSRTVAHPALWERRKINLERCIGRFANAYLSERDIGEIIPQWDKPDTLFYIDPPYPGTDCRSYNNPETLTESRLQTLLAAISGSYILSCYQLTQSPPSARLICSRPCRKNIGVSKQVREYLYIKMPDSNLAAAFNAAYQTGWDFR